MMSDFKLILLFISAIAADNCFYNNHLTYVYDMPDYSGNYTSGKEYWMAKATTCDFIQDTNSKVTWYSSDITGRF